MLSPIRAQRSLYEGRLLAQVPRFRTRWQRRMIFLKLRPRLKEAQAFGGRDREREREPVPPEAARTERETPAPLPDWRSGACRAPCRALAGTDGGAEGECSRFDFSAVILPGGNIHLRLVASIKAAGAIFTQCGNVWTEPAPLIVFSSRWIPGIDRGGTRCHRDPRRRRPRPDCDPAPWRDKAPDLPARAVRRDRNLHRSIWPPRC